MYRAANWILRAALAGKAGVDLAFLPPPPGEGEGEDGRNGVPATGVQAADAAPQYLDDGNDE